MRCPWLGPFLVIALGCGPTLEPQDETSGDQSTSSTSGPATSQGPSTTAPSDTTAVGTTTSGDVDSSGIPFIADPDFGGCTRERTTYECDLWAQDCCPNEKCVPWSSDGDNSWDATRCSPVVRDPAAPGEPCYAEVSGVSGIDDCDATSMCWNVDPESLEGYCMLQCTGSPDDPMCPDGTTCAIANDGVIALCLSRCDPLDVQCMDGEICVPIEGDYVCVPSAAPPAGLPGDPCTNDFECYPDGVCAPAMDYAGCASPGCCTPYCNHLDGSGEALCAMLDPAMLCEPMYGPGTAPEGLEHLGTCRLP